MGRTRALAGIIGPATFVTAAAAAARRAPGYSHKRSPISGLAAKGMPSAPVMIPGFVAFGLAGLLQDMDDRTVQGVVRMAGVATVAAGLARCSSVDCPMPMVDDDATASDAAHALASIIAFACWTALPCVAAIRPGPAWYRRASAFLGLLTAVGYVVNSTSLRSRSERRGRAQRLFLAPVLIWYALTSLRALRQSTTS